MFQKYKYRGASILAPDEFLDFWKAFAGETGYASLHSYIKLSNDLSQQLSSILLERQQLEVNYSRSLTKIGQKVTKVGTKTIGTVARAWRTWGTAMVEEANCHRVLATAIEEVIFKPLHNVAESYHKRRKPVEALIDKKLQNLKHKRNEENKLKKHAFGVAKDAEKSFEEYRLHSGAAFKDEKDRDKMAKKSKAQDEAVRKSEKEYYEYALKAERTRADWEAAVYKGCSTLLQLEVDRLKQNKAVMAKYLYQLAHLSHSQVEAIKKFEAAAETINIHEDISNVIMKFGSQSPFTTKQLLMDFYAEDFHNRMESVRREHRIRTYLNYIMQDRDREVNAKHGIEKILDRHKTTAGATKEATMDDVRLQLIAADALVTYLDACYFKLRYSLAQAVGAPKPDDSSGLSQFIKSGTDNHGLPKTELRIPADELSFPASGAAHGGGACGGYTYEESEYEEIDYSPIQTAISTPVSDYSAAASPQPTGLCRVLYQFDARDGNELTLMPGMIVNIISKVDQSWWTGECNGLQGMFPATYVEEI